MKSPIPQEPTTNAIYWLGQAGFWIDVNGFRILIDPYLSDSLANKYRGTKFSHTRMLPIPIAVDDLPKPDLVLITHAHTDHMDPETLVPLAERFTELQFVVPIAAIETARARIGETANITDLDADQQVSADGFTFHAIASAHEEFDRDTRGHYPYLGYIVNIGGKTIYHSGDTVAYNGLSNTLRNFSIDYALLPVNGRDATRRANGVSGNMTLTEAIELCETANIPRMIAHHWGMFDFNTLDPKAIDTALHNTHSLEIIRPSIERPIKI